MNSSFLFYNCLQLAKNENYSLFLLAEILDNILKKMKYLVTVLFFVLVNGIYAQSAKVKSADRYFDDFEYIDAIKLYEEVVNEGNSDMHICKQLAEAYRRIGNSTQSEYWYRMLIDMGTDDPIDYYYYAEALKSNKKYKEAELVIKKFSDMQTDDSRIHREIQAQKKVDRFSIADSNAFEIVKLVANSKFSDFSPAYYTKDKIVFSSARNENKSIYSWDNQPFIDLFVADKLPSLQLVNARLFLQTASSDYHKGPVAFDSTCNTIHFTRNNIAKKRKLFKNKVSTNNLKIFTAQNINSQWTNFQEFKYNSDDYSTGHPSLSQDGNKLYFASDRPGGYGQTDIWVCSKVNEEWSEPQNLGSDINTEGNEMFPYIHSDGTLYFSSDGLTGFGGLDVYSATNLGDSTETVLNLGYPLNGPKDDFGYIMDNEKLTGYFSSNRDGGLGFDDIYAFRVINPNLLLSDLEKSKLAEQQKAETVATNSNQNNPNSATNLNTNPTDSLKRTESGMFFDGQKVVLGEAITLPNIYYDFNKSNIRPDAALELQKVIAFMKKYPKAIIELSSHTDSRGKFQYNMDLSQKRADAAVDFIANYGDISKDRIIARGYGKTKLVNYCVEKMPCSEADHQLNRRTEIRILKK